MESGVRYLMQSRISKLFEIDVRSLALFRIALGILILLDLGTRALDLRGHYTDGGVWPRALAAHELALERHWYFSLHLLGGSTVFAAGLFAVAAMVAVALIIGYRTRLATVLSWILLISLHMRMERVVNSGDMLFRMLLFWGMFLPLGACRSVDARQGKAGQPQAVFSAATVALLLQVCVVYWFSVAYKWEPGWTFRGDALHTILGREAVTTRFGSALLAFPELLRVLTFATLGLEMIGPVLAFVPIANGRLRTAVVFVFWVFHLGVLGTTMKVGLFPLISAVGWVAFLPSWFWERVLRPAPVNAGVPLRTHWAVNGAVGTVFLLTLFWNLRELNPKRFGALLPRAADPIMYLLNLDQKYAMFSGQHTFEVWLLALGRLHDGTEVNVLTGGESKGEQRPKRLAEQFRTFRWSLYPEQANNKSRPARVKVYAAYLKREWNRKHPLERAVDVLEIYCMYEAINGSRSAPEAELIYSDLESTSAKGTGASVGWGMSVKQVAQ
ncbi:MAG: hypothetical protein JWR69_1057 [Pedosphaera sp.]|nr:hypothetical protein [Pedosphaera sp.]